MAIDTSLGNVRVLTHSAIRIQSDDGVVIYSDPFDLQEELHDADIVVITHAHYDHLSPEDFAKVAGTKTVVVVPASAKEDAQALNTAQVEYLEPGESVQIESIAITAVPAYNVELERLQFHPKENAWVGYLLTIDGTTYYIAGDTDQNPDNEQVVCDVALVPIGGTYTMDPVQAATFVNTLKPQIVVPTHYGTITGNKDDIETFESLVNPLIFVVRKMEWHA